MYTPSAFREDDLEALHETMRAARLSNFVTRHSGLPFDSISRHSRANSPKASNTL